MARPTKLTADIQDRICKAIAGGNFREVAAGWCGIGKRTLHEWMRRGLSDHPKDAPFVLFRQAVLEAERAAEVQSVAMLRQAGQTDPKLIQWWLERKFPERWGRDTYRVRELERQMAELERFLKRDAQGPPPPHVSPDPAGPDDAPAGGL